MPYQLCRVSGRKRGQFIAASGLVLRVPSPEYRGFRDLFWVTAALTISSLVCFVVLYKSNQPAAYFLLPCRLWE